MWFKGPHKILRTPNSSPFRKRLLNDSFQKMKGKLLLSSIIAIFSILTGLADDGLLRVCTLNVDGLPQKVLFLKINDDGPAETYTPVISQFLADAGFDIIGVQENFNFNPQLHSALDKDYDADEWSGGVASSGSFGEIVKLKFSCDGLGAFWKKDIKLKGYERVIWLENCGVLDHSSDGLATKGFRYYEFELSDGFQIQLYNMHMDASTTEDELAENDGPDREARQAQYAQLFDHIMTNMDYRPIIVLGDLNSYYARDKVKQIFIDRIAETGRAEATDAWIEMQRGGIYPEPVEGPVSYDSGGWLREGEGLDKIICINPIGSNMRLETVNAEVVTDGFYRNSTTMPLSDHFPLAADLRCVWADVSSIDKTLKPAACSRVYDLHGRRVGKPQRGVNIIRNADGTRSKVIIAK